MSLTCKGCHKKLGDNRRSFAGHTQYCMKFKEYQQRIFATLGNIGIALGKAKALGDTSIYLKYFNGYFGQIRRGGLPFIL